MVIEKDKQIVVHTPTQGDYDELMVILERKGYTWSPQKPTTIDYWDSYKGKTCVQISKSGLMYCSTDYWAKEGYGIISLSDYKSSYGDGERKFKVGDEVIGNKQSTYYVTEKGWKGKVKEILDHGSIKVHSLNGSGRDFDVEERCFDLLKSEKIIVDPLYKPYTTEDFCVEEGFKVGDIVVREVDRDCHWERDKKKTTVVGVPGTKQYDGKSYCCANKGMEVSLKGGRLLWVHQEHYRLVKGRIINKESNKKTICMKSVKYKGVTYHHGDKVEANLKISFESQMTYVKDAKISINDDGEVHICQNKRSGDDGACDKYGYDYSWLIRRGGEDELRTDCFKNLILKTKSKKSLIMKLTPMLKRLLDKKAQTLYKAEYINGDLELTEDGRSALNTILFEANKDELVKLAQEKLDEEKADK